MSGRIGYQPERYIDPGSCCGCDYCHVQIISHRPMPRFGLAGCRTARIVAGRLPYPENSPKSLLYRAKRKHLLSCLSTEYFLQHLYSRTSLMHSLILSCATSSEKTSLTSIIRFPGLPCFTVVATCVVLACRLMSRESMGVLCQRDFFGVSRDQRRNTSRRLTPAWM